MDKKPTNEGSSSKKIATVLTFGSLLPLGLAWVGMQILDYWARQDFEVSHRELYVTLFLVVAELCASGLLVGGAGGVMMSLEKSKTKTS